MVAKREQCNFRIKKIEQLPSGPDQKIEQQINRRKKLGALRYSLNQSGDKKRRGT
jgi:hypothetical protein